MNLIIITKFPPIGINLALIILRNYSAKLA